MICISLDFIKKNKKQILFFAAMCILILMRMIFLDRDLPPTGVINYQPIDEGAYSYLALNKINYGLINPDFSFSSLQQYTPPYSRLNLIGNLFSYIGMVIFGKTYMGMRIGSVVCVMIVFIFIYKILVLLDLSLKEKKWIHIGLFLYFACEFTFLVASRVNETSIYRMLLLVIAFYCFIKYEKNEKKRFFLSAFMCTFSCLCIYITNIFLVIAFYVMIGIYILLDHSKYKVFIYALIGSLAAFLIVELYLRIFWHTGIIENTLKTFTSFHTKNSYTSSNTVWDIIKTTCEFCSNNFVFYNLPFIYLLIIKLPKLIKDIIKKKDINMLFIILTISAFYCQTLFTTDFIRRKFIIIAPLIIILFFRSLQVSSEGKTKLNDKIYTFFGLIFCICILLYRIYIVNDGSRLDFETMDKTFLVSFHIAALLLLFLYTIFKGLNKKIYFAVFCIVMTTNIYMDLKFIYLNPTYSEKEIMEQLGEMNLQPKYVVGTYMLGYSLYNDYVPILNNAEKMKEILSQHTEFYYLDYASDDIVDLSTYLEQFMDGTDYKLVEVRRFERDFQRYGHKRPIAIYKVERK